ncbi:hypothetical protein Acr_01g0013980 [Actinidia rufa]|uniref:Uncharacterized protein n=1 Tax=Actinidia rufa TaxID=165716 RepID=A0A7J0E6M2_9ERIC|nr:hypothetical protein Acr_01g0013980 [Actinidia rufa]
MYDFLSHLQEPLPRSHRLRRLHRPHEELLRRIICQHLRRARRNPPLSPPKPPNSPPPALSSPDPGSTASLAESSTWSTRRRTFGAASTSPCLRPAKGTSAPSRSTTASLTTETMTTRLLSNFPLLQHQEADCGELQGTDLTEESREAVGSSPRPWHCHADALAAIAIIDELEPKQALSLFLDSRKPRISLSAPSQPISLQINLSMLKYSVLNLDFFFFDYHNFWCSKAGYWVFLGTSIHMLFAPFFKEVSNI